MNAEQPGDRWPPSRVVWVLAVTVAVALGVRLWHLDRDTLTHAEVYVPRLAMPDYVSAPPPRSTLAETVRGTLHHDNHPPGYYAAMWLWTSVAGTSLVALRLPSALAGAAAVALIFGVIRRRDGPATALTAAALLALHGHHVFWSRQARMWVLLAALALISLWLLDSLGRDYRRGKAAAYVAVVAAGLWTEYSFWPFFLAQISWEVFRRGEERSLPGTVVLQLLALAAAAPVLFFLRAHLISDRTAYMAGGGIVDHVSGFVLFQWLVRTPPAGEVYGPAASIAVLMVLATGGLFLFAGLAPPVANDVSAPVGAPSPPRSLRLAAVGSAVLFSAWLIASGERGVAAAVALVSPVLVLIGLVPAARAWPRIALGLRALRANPVVRRIGEDAPVIHTVVPLFVLVVLSHFEPSVAPRTLLFLTPFALWLVARGLARLLPRAVPRASVTALLLLACGVSAYQYTRPGYERWDYQALAEAMEPMLAKDDVILIPDVWYAQPMHYYFPPDLHRTGDFGEHFAAGPGDRIWVVILDGGDEKAWEERSGTLGHYAMRLRVGGDHGYAMLLEPATDE